MPGKSPQVSRNGEHVKKIPALQDFIQSSLAPLTAAGAFLTTVVAVLTNWEKVEGFYESSPITVGTAVAIAAALVAWAIIGRFLSRQSSRWLLPARLLAVGLIVLVFGTIVAWPRICLITHFCGPSPPAVFRINFLISPAYALDRNPLEILSLTVDRTRSSFVLKRDDLSIHALREDKTRISIEYDRDMLQVFKSASCRGIRGEGPVEDALPVLRSVLKERGRNDLVRKLADYNGYRDLVQHGGDKGFLEARPTAAELADLLKKKPEWYELLMRWMVECVGIADPVLIWTLRNNSDKPLLLTAVDYAVLDVGQVRGGGPDTLLPIDVMPHDLYHRTGVQSQDVAPQIKLPPAEPAAIRIRYRLEATDWGLTWLVKPTFRTAEGVSADGPELKIFSAKNRT